MFTQEHFIWIGLCTAFVATMTAVSVRRHLSFRTCALIMAGIAAGSELSKILSNMVPVDVADPSMGMHIDPEALPFHLCSLFIFMFFYLPFCKNDNLRRRLTSFFIPAGLIGATLAILIPTNGTDFTTPGAYQCFVYHAGMVWFAAYLVLTRQVELGVSEWLKNLTALFCLSIVEIWINGALSAYQTNFLFVVRPPMDGLPLLNLDHGWLAYYATLVVVGATLVTLVHLPFILAERHSYQEPEQLACRKA